MMAFGFLPPDAASDDELTWTVPAESPDGFVHEVLYATSRDGYTVVSEAYRCRTCDRERHEGHTAECARHRSQQEGA